MVIFRFFFSFSGRTFLKCDFYWVSKNGVALMHKNEMNPGQDGMNTVAAGIWKVYIKFLSSCKSKNTLLVSRMFHIGHVLQRIKLMFSPLWQLYQPSSPKPVFRLCSMVIQSVGDLIFFINILFDPQTVLSSCLIRLYFVQSYFST